MRVCLVCGALTEARLCPNCSSDSVRPPRVEPAAVVLILGIGAVCVIAALIYASRPVASLSEEAPIPALIEEKQSALAYPDDAASQVITRYGAPDFDLDSSTETPRPPLVTRRFEYRAAGVRVAFIPQAKAGDKPPFSRWTLIGCIDSRTETKIRCADAFRRLAAGR